MIIAVVNMKGGAGKSTLVANIACIMHDTMEEKVVILDLDSQETSQEWVSVGKIPVVGAVSRTKGTVVAKVINSVDAQTLNEFVLDMVSQRVSLIATDEWRGYSRLGEDGWPHGVVKHSAGQYVNGNIHTNTIEGFWSLIKRGVMGTFHKVSAKYLPLYIKEFEFRYNNRKNPDIFGTAVAGC